MYCANSLPPKYTASFGFGRQKKGQEPSITSSNINPVRLLHYTDGNREPDS